VIVDVGCTVDIPGLLCVHDAPSAMTALILIHRRMFMGASLVELLLPLSAVSQKAMLLDRRQSQPTIATHTAP